MRDWTIYGLRLEHPGARLDGRIVYVGYTRLPLAKRLRAHKIFSRERNTPLACAMRRYGADAFTIEMIVGNLATIEEAKSTEVETIDRLRTLVTLNNGYNATRGGDGPHHDVPTYRVPFLAAMKRRTDDGAWQKNCARGQRKRWDRPAERERQSEILRQLHRDPDYAASHRERMKNRSSKTEFRTKQRERTLQLRSDPDFIRLDEIGRAKRWERHWIERGRPDLAAKYTARRHALETEATP